MGDIMSAGTFIGPKVPGRNLDKINVEAGMRAFYELGYNSPETAMVIEYSLMLWRRGEEPTAERKAIDTTFYGINLTAWRMVLAAAMAGA